MENRTFYIYKTSTYGKNIHETHLSGDASLSIQLVFQCQTTLFILHYYTQGRINK